MIKPYIKKISEVARRGDAREESFYSTLVELLKEYTDSTVRKKTHITTLPKKTEAGNPDFRVWDGKQHITGYIEAKAPTVENLDRVEESEQLKRYLHTFPNLILTNFFEFRLYRNGTLTDKVLIGRPFVVHKLKTVPPVENEKDFLKLLERFFAFSLPRVYDARNLAVELAKRTRFLRDEVIAQELEEEERKRKGFILGFYEAFRKYLISGLSKEDFADLFSQTVAYGLFAARTRSGKEFNRKLAYDNIPRTIGILRDVFKFISLEDLPRQMEWIIDDISEVLAVTDVNNILHQYFREHKGSDPIVHFYETFLSEYDPETREKRGVYYTPEPVVSYIVRSLNTILKEKFNRPDGFASDTVTVLDPAGGTLTFIAEAAKLAVEEFVSKYGKGKKKDFIRNHILNKNKQADDVLSNNFYSFELMMAPYAVGHLKMSFLLEELGYRLQPDDRFMLFLTNALEMEDLEQTDLPGMASLSEESHNAGMVKKEKPILVVLGNPPYSGISANRGKWITEQIENYKYVDGKHFGEKKHWLQDDYVKFIRFAQWKLDQAGEGVLGFITNHSYLDNPTFRGMRQSLMESFNEIYILDLHGNSLKKEKCPDGSKDENVFDIMQGVSIALFIKKIGVKGKCRVYHSDLWGLRPNKYGWLLDNELKTTDWNKLKPTSPYFFLVPREEKGREVYEKYWKVTDIFPVNVTGIVTARDKFVIDSDKNSLNRRIELFRNLSISDDIIKQTFKLKDTRGWKFSEARQELADDEDWKSYFNKILYRPFDIRHIYYTPKMVDWPRPEVMRHMMQDNLGLITPKQFKEEPGAFITQNIMTHKTVSAYDINYIFPLYLYPVDGGKQEEAKQKKKRPRFTFGSAVSLFEPQAEYGARRPNISPEIMERLTENFSKPPPPEQIFFYIYAVLYSNTYRTKYAEFLKIDFPRVPFTKDYRLFMKMVGLGSKLVDLHLLKSREIDKPIVKFQGKGDDKIEKPRYDEKENRLHINKDQYFEGITKELWQYQIGGYRVSEKWLKDRKGRTLSLDDIKHYCKVITALQKTIELQKAIDDIYPEVEKETV